MNHTAATRLRILARSEGATGWRLAVPEDKIPFREHYAVAQAMGLPPNRVTRQYEAYETLAPEEREWAGVLDVGYPEKLQKMIGGPTPTTFTMTPPPPEEIVAHNTRYILYRATVGSKTYDFLAHSDDVQDEYDLEEAHFGREMPPEIPLLESDSLFPFIANSTAVEVPLATLNPRTRKKDAGYVTLFKAGVTLSTANSKGRRCTLIPLIYETEILHGMSWYKTHVARLTAADDAAEEQSAAELREIAQEAGLIFEALETPLSRKTVGLNFYTTPQRNQIFQAITHGAYRHTTEEDPPLRAIREKMRPLTGIVARAYVQALLRDKDLALFLQPALRASRLSE